MGYFNINRILYSLRYIVKYFFFSLLVIAFIVICLLLSSIPSFAAPYVPVPPEIVAQANDWNFGNGIVFIDQYGDYYIPQSELYNEQQQSSGNWTIRKASVDGQDEVIFVNPSYYRMKLYKYTNGSYTEVPLALDFSTNSRIEKESSTRLLSVVYAKNDIVYIAYPGEENFSVYFPASLAAPRFENYDPIGNEQVNTLVTGETGYFYFEIPRKQTYDPNGDMLDNYYPFYFYIHDVTEIEPPQDIYYNGTTSLFFNLNEEASVNGQIYRKFLLDVGQPTVEYAVPMVYPFGSYKNGHTYRLVLQWNYGDDPFNSSTTQFKTYEWTTNFTTSGAELQEKNGNDPTLNNSTSLEDYIKNQYFNGSFIIDYFNVSKSYIPILNSPIIRFFSDLFLDFYDAFTEISYKEITFNIPHTDTDLVFTSNFIYDNIPSPFLTFIRSFYWFSISLYILKNIYSIYEEISSGDLLHSSTMKTDNIQTKFL